MDDETLEKWQQLVDSMKLRKPGASPWNANTLEANFYGASHGEKCVIQFLLNVWDPGGQWSCGKFDVIEAYGVWPEETRHAFLSWASKPWWP